MSWRELRAAPCRTHHLREGVPAYSERFDEVFEFHEPGLAAVRRGEQGWHIDEAFERAYARTFVKAFGFYEGLAAVVSAGGWHHIGSDGADVYPQRHAWCGNFQGGRCTVRSPGGEYFHLRPQGQPAYAQRWRYAGDYRKGIAVVQASDGRSTHIDLEGELLHGRWFVDLDVFHKGIARARDGQGWMHVDRRGQPLYARRFAAVEPFYNGQARAERFDGGLEVIDEAGEQLVELRACAPAAQRAES